LAAANTAIDVSAQIMSAANVLLKKTFITNLPVILNPAPYALAFELSCVLLVSDNAHRKVAVAKLTFDVTK